MRRTSWPRVCQTQSAAVGVARERTETPAETHRRDTRAVANCQGHTTPSQAPGKGLVPPHRSRAQRYLGNGAWPRAQFWGTGVPRTLGATQPLSACSTCKGPCPCPVAPPRDLSMPLSHLVLVIAGLAFFITSRGCPPRAGQSISSLAAALRDQSHHRSACGAQPAVGCSSKLFARATLSRLPV